MNKNQINDELPQWMIKPTSILYSSINFTHAIFLDENGDSDMSYIMKCVAGNKKIDENSKYFSVTSVLCKTEEIENIANNFNSIKNKFWPPEGCYEYPNGQHMKVCFHSNEIRRKKGPFSINAIDYDDFMVDLSNTMAGLPISLCSCFINKKLLYDKYGTYVKSPYNIAVTFILERIVKFQLKDTDKVIIILESRGKKEDIQVLDTIISFIKYGSTYVKKSYFNKIVGVYFNKKRPERDCKKTIFGLEVADLCAYPIFKYCKLDIKDCAFTLIEHKIYNYPNYEGRGIKKFP